MEKLNDNNDFEEDFEPERRDYISLTKKERRAAIFGALGAALLIGLVFIVGLSIVLGLMLLFWK